MLSKYKYVPCTSWVMSLWHHRVDLVTVLAWAGIPCALIIILWHNRFCTWKEHATQRVAEPQASFDLIKGKLHPKKTPKKMSLLYRQGLIWYLLLYTLLYQTWLWSIWLLLFWLTLPNDCVENSVCNQHVHINDGAVVGFSRKNWRRQSHLQIQKRKSAESDNDKYYVSFIKHKILYGSKKKT